MPVGLVVVLSACSLSQLVLLRHKESQQHEEQLCSRRLNIIISEHSAVLKEFEFGHSAKGVKYSNKVSLRNFI
jgi:hypothetical protein